MDCKSQPKVNLTVTADSVSFHKWWGSAGRFMTFTREEAKVLLSLLQEELSNDQLSGNAASCAQVSAIVPE